MKKFFTLISFILAALTASAQYGQYVGGDISMLPAYEEHNSGYLDESGNKINDLLQWFISDCGWNSFRVRLFVNPKNTDHDGVIQDIDYVEKLGKRIKDAGAKFMLDFHYSDTWVDASHIQAPEAWKNMTVDEKAAQIYTYTKESLEALKNYGAEPDLVQVGNEIMYGFMGIKVSPYDNTTSDWNSYLKVLNQACKAVRDVCPKAKIIVHTDKPCNTDYINYYYGKLDDYGIDYDVIGLSYYPFWHGVLSSLKTSLTKIKSNFPSKKVQIVETAYYFQNWPTSGINYNTKSTWAATANGQYNFVKDLVDALKDYDNVEGLFYWFPEEAGCGDDTNWDSQKYGNVITAWQNRGFWWEDTKTTGHWPVASTYGFAPKLLKGFLNPTGIETVIKENATSSDKVYTISGQRVSKTSKPGMYVVGNKKVMVK